MAAQVGRAAGKGAKKMKMVAQPSYAPWGSIVNSQLKANKPPPPSSNLAKFLNLPSSSVSDFSKIVSKFVKIHAGRNPGKKKGKAFEEKLNAVLDKGKNIGVHDVAKLMSDQFATRA